jgi:hypothetical protein
MATRPPQRGRREDDEAVQDQRERDEPEGEESTSMSNNAGQRERSESEAESLDGLQDFGRVLQEQIAQALEPAMEEFRQQVEQTVQEHSTQVSQLARQPEGDAQRSSGPNRAEEQQAEEQQVDERQSDEQQSARPRSQQAGRQADSPPAQRDADRPAQQERDGERPAQQVRDRERPAPQERDGERAAQQDRGAERPAQREQRSDGGERRQLATTGGRRLQRSTQIDRRPAEREAQPRVFDGRSAARVALLRLARRWHEAGSTYQAIHAYTQVLIRYPGGGAANAAAEELLELADDLEREGRFHSALNILNRLDQLL